jgi:hypothetical protein
VIVHSGKSIRYGYKRTSGGAIDLPAESGRPKTPFSGREIVFSWEINHPSINAGSDVNWSTLASYASDPDIEIIGGNTLLSLLKWDVAFDVPSSFTKTSLALVSANVFVGSDVTNGAMASNQTNVATSLYVDTDNTAANQLKVWEATAWPAAPSAPSYAGLVWTTSPTSPPLLNNQHRRLWLKMHNSAGGSFNTGWMRIVVRAVEI